MPHERNCFRSQVKYALRTVRAEHIPTEDSDRISGSRNDAGAAFVIKIAYSFLFEFVKQRAEIRRDLFRVLQEVIGALKVQCFGLI